MAVLRLTLLWAMLPAAFGGGLMNRLLLRLFRLLGMPKREALHRSVRFCEQRGITCRRRKVTSLMFPNRSLTGRLGREMGLLGDLEHLDLSRNQLKGPLPRNLNRLAKLRSLMLYQNRLKGPLPNLSTCEELADLDLSWNQLTGDLENLQGLELDSLDLHQNQFVGRIPGFLFRSRRLRWVALSSNRLSGPLPCLKNLKTLEFLALPHNRLEGPIPELPPGLHWLDLSHNQLTGRVPSSLRLLHLETLMLDDNQLFGPLPALETPMLRLLQMDHNQLSGSLPASLCELQSLQSLWLSSNRLSGLIPSCLLQLRNLRELLLHENRLEGAIPEPSRSSELTVLALHHNRLKGVLPNLARLPQLAVFTAHSNFLWGRIHRLNLTTGCLDNYKYVSPDSLPCERLNPSCHGHALFASQAEVLGNCPKTCGACDTYGFRTARVTLHRNRFSCDPSLEISEVAVQATAVMGNMLGSGREMAAPWIDEEERQDFLYFSAAARNGRQQVLGAALVAALAAVLRGRWLWRQLQADAASAASPEANVVRSSKQVLCVAVCSAGLCFATLPAFLHGARYYECGQPFAKATAAYLADAPQAELAVALSWTLCALLFAFAIKAIPFVTETKKVALDLRLRVKRCGWWLLWLLLVVPLFSFPSILFAVAQSLPKQPKIAISTRALKIIHQGAPHLVVLLDMALAHRVAQKFAAFSSISSDRLLMSLRLCSAWLLSLLTTMVLHENCIGGWKWFWHVCDKSHPDHGKFHWYIYGEPVLDTDRDMCQLHSRWWSEGRCSRATIEGLAPLLLSKLLNRSLVQPLITLATWRFSRLQPGPDLARGRHLELPFKRTSGSLDSTRQHALLTTLLETSIFWGPLVPLVSACVVSAMIANLLLFRHGTEALGVCLSSDAANCRASVSKTYLAAVLLASCGFQCWHFWSNSLCGWPLLVLQPLLVLLVLKLPVPAKHLRSLPGVENWVELPAMT
ncbi:unnamed protein product [Effrenium voratum]|uniref:Uncharacterized protein n=1 Tax=Effrenium voratum TaxID=2562239 RepID=A0AA36HT00_9DINO|nr:unnamed protein product [Effrenium voratum]